MHRPTIPNSSNNAENLKNEANIYFAIFPTFWFVYDASRHVWGVMLGAYAKRRSAQGGHYVIVKSFSSGRNKPGHLIACNLQVVLGGFCHIVAVAVVVLVANQISWQLVNMLCSASCFLFDFDNPCWRLFDAQARSGLLCTAPCDWGQATLRCRAHHMLLQCTRAQEFSRAHTCLCDDCSVASTCRP
eukprot:4440962-Amphidinium_carterae.1